MIDDVFIHLRILPRKDEVDLLIEFAAHIPNQPAHFLKQRGHRDHADVHHNILQLVDARIQLPGGGVKAVVGRPAEIRVAENHGLGRDDLPDNIEQLVKLVNVNADKVLPRNGFRA